MSIVRDGGVAITDNKGHPIRGIICPYVEMFRQDSDLVVSGVYQMDGEEDPCFVGALQNLGFRIQRQVIRVRLSARDGKCADAEEGQSDGLQDFGFHY